MSIYEKSFDELTDEERQAWEESHEPKGGSCEGVGMAAGNGRAPRYTTYITDETVDSLCLEKKGVGLSRRLNVVVAQWRLILRDHTPELTTGEWCVICDALDGVYLWDEFADWSSIGQFLDEIEDLPGLGEKWGVDQEELVKKTREMSTVERAAVINVVRRFWVLDEPDETYSDGLKRAGARVAD